MSDGWGWILYTYAHEDIYSRGMAENVQCNPVSDGRYKGLLYLRMMACTKDG